MGKMRRLTGMGMLMALVVGLMCFGLVLGDAGVEQSGESGGSDKVAPLIKEIERLKSHLEKKDAHVGVVEKELKVLKEQKDGGGSKEALSKLEAELEAKVNKVKQLEEQLASATKESEQAHKYAAAQKKRAELAEANVRDLDAKHEKALASSLDAKKYAAEVEKALKAADATVAQAEKRLQSHGEELTRVHNQWLPPWAAIQLAVLQNRAHSKWSSHAKPHVDAAYKYSSERAAAAHAFVKPHLDTVGPQARKHWKTVSDSLAPHVELVRTKTKNGYEVVRKDYVGKTQEFLQPHLNTVVETGRPYVTLVQEHSRPYVDHVSTVSKPYLEHARKFVNPYFESASPYYRNAVSAAMKQHESLQQTVRHNLSRHEGLASIITKELVWFLASALLALPVLFVLLILSSTLRGKKPAPAKRPTPAGSATSSTPGTKPKRSKKADK